jgi:hypothetical protein
MKQLRRIPWWLVAGLLAGPTVVWLLIRLGSYLAQ